MDSKTVQTENKNGTQTLSLPKLGEIAWQLNLDSKEFHADENAFVTVFGLGRNILHAEEVLKRLTPSQRQIAIDTFRHVMKSGESQVFRCCIISPLERVHFVEFYVEKKNSQTLVGTLTPLLTIESCMQVAEVFYSLFENPHHGVLITDENTRILVCNQYFEQTTGYQRKDIAGLKTSIFNAEKHSDLYYQNLWKQLTELNYWSGEILTRTCSGDNVPQELTIQKINDGIGGAYYVGISTNLSERFNNINDKDNGGVDLLTQLSSKDRFLDQLEGLCQSNNSDFGLIMLAIQPKYVEENPSAIKKEFARFLQNGSGATLCGYLGSDRFVVCLKFSKTQVAHIRQINQTIKRFFSSFRMADDEISNALTQGSIGISVLGIDAKTPRSLFSHANQALLEMHSGHKHRVSFYDQAIHKQIEQKKATEIKLTDVILKQKIEVFYQPIIDLNLWEVSKFEALCRFPEELSCETSVQELINIAEDLDLIEELDVAVAKKALDALPELQKSFGDQVGITFNRSVHTSASIAHILSQTAKMIVESQVSPSKVTVEITENAYFESEEQQANGLRELREAGVTLAVDDFGTGYSSFEYLNRCNFDVLKIDRAFIKDIQVNSNQFRIVKSLTELSHQLGLKVVAEGVETEHELTLMVQVGVDYAQGYFFSKPFALNSDSSEEFGQFDLTVFPKQFGERGGLLQLVTTNVPHLDPGDPISLAHEYFEREELNILPVVAERVCVGFIDREALNLHLTPAMGTDLESMKEATIWKKRVNQVMVLGFSEVNWQTRLSALPSIMSQNETFPWILIDERGYYKGVIEMHSLLRYLKEKIM
ncbi:EAL domain-containing protein [Vibrio vulnificus]|uniref:EAL domain-containing protein n=1 Tax=Vibrio vulnificus TaxID=672 RepID=UPI0012AE363D|nr:EAL domain-containing protein [Vibrio vulnificus]ELI0348619.1 EAL domain-containing protein [Vibrio vulnificus]MCU8222078.1 EAL domain-containing protein [Vibrio vulnificus]